MHPQICAVYAAAIPADRPHAILAADCPVHWHDGYDHEPILATRAAALRITGGTE